MAEKSLNESEVCLVCVRAQEEVVKMRSAIDSRIVEVFGGRKALEEFTFEKYKPSPAQIEAKNKIAAFDPKTMNYFVHGPCGVGKTHLIVAKCRQFVLSDIIYLKPTTLMRKMRGHESGYAEQMELQKIARAQVLIIDDLGVGRSTEFSLQILYEILDMRDMNKQNGLILTSNLSLEELGKANNDDRVISRIAGLCRFIHIPGEDYRLIKRKQTI